MSHETPQTPPSLEAGRIGPRRRIQDLVPVTLASFDGGVSRLRTEARVGHDGERLVVAFSAAYDRLHLDPELPRDRSVPGLWHLDVVEVFVARPGGGYREIEATPLGQWLALAFDGPRRPSLEPWTPRPEVTAHIAERHFEVVLGISLEDLGIGPSGGGARLGLFRIHGREPGRHYLSHLPTGTAVPDFHLPERWAALCLQA